MPLEHAGRQLASHCIELLAPHVVFEAGDRRLRGDRRSRGPARATTCEWGRRPAGRHRSHRDGHTRCRRSAGRAGPPAYAGPCPPAGRRPTLGASLHHAVLPLRGFEQDRIDRGPGGSDSLWYRRSSRCQRSVSCRRSIECLLRGPYGVPASSYSSIARSYSHCQASDDGSRYMERRCCRHFSCQSVV